tara:strand:- start:1274 stop:1669 length:396 start_codon:yes stop_codon:yes gene_type:complete
MTTPTIDKYLEALIPKTLVGQLNKSNKDIVTLLKVDNLYIKIINFYHKLLVSNQRISEGKDTCPVYVNWDSNPAYSSIPGITCGQVKYLLRNMRIDQDFGKVVELSCRYLQALKFTHNMKANNLVYYSELL